MAARGDVPPATASNTGPRARPSVSVAPRLGRLCLGFRFGALPARSRQPGARASLRQWKAKHCVARPSGVTCASLCHVLASGGVSAAEGAAPPLSGGRLSPSAGGTQRCHTTAAPKNDGEERKTNNSCTVGRAIRRVMGGGCSKLALSSDVTMAKAGGMSLRATSTQPHWPKYMIPLATKSASHHRISLERNETQQFRPAFAHACPIRTMPPLLAQMRRCATVVSLVIPGTSTPTRRSATRLGDIPPPGLLGSRRPPGSPLPLSRHPWVAMHVFTQGASCSLTGAGSLPGGCTFRGASGRRQVADRRPRCPPLVASCMSGQEVAPLHCLAQARIDGGGEQGVVGCTLATCGPGIGSVCAAEPICLRSARKIHEVLLAMRAAQQTIMRDGKLGDWRGGASFLVPNFNGSPPPDHL